jgi:DNA invertase Pin-like site-specific DNA recombinase
LVVENDAAQWTTKDLVDVEYQRVIEMLKLGLSLREIAEETSIPKSTVHRMKQRAEAERANT